MTTTIIHPDTGVGSVTVDARGYAQCVFFADALAGAEEVTISLGGGAQFVEVDTLSAGTPSLTLPGGLYLLDKTASAGACGVYADLINVS